MFRGTAEEETGEHEESLGSKVKETEIDREMTDQEQAFVDSFHISHMMIRRRQKRLTGF